MYTIQFHSMETPGKTYTFWSPSAVCGSGPGQRYAVTLGFPNDADDEAYFPNATEAAAWLAAREPDTEANAFRKALEALV